MTHRIAFVVIAVVAFALDRISKLLVLDRIAVGDAVSVIGSTLEFRHTENTGIAFGLFAGAGVVVVIGTLIVGAMLFFFLLRVHPSDWLTQIGGALITGGALGNLVDRVHYGYVVDFIHVPRWPTFNVADVWITLGVAFVLLAQLRSTDELPEGPTS